MLILKKEEILAWDNAHNIEAILVDGSTGGLGNMFDVSVLQSFMPTLTKPIIVAGGLTPENVGDVIHALHPRAVDVSSGVESTRGVKNAALICAFIEAVIEARNA